MITRSWKELDNYDIQTTYKVTRGTDWVRVEMEDNTNENTRSYTLDRITCTWSYADTGDGIGHGSLLEDKLNRLYDKFCNILLNEKIEKELASHNTGAQ